MPAILLLAHAPLASSLKAVATHVYPECSQTLQAIDVEPGANPEQVEGRLLDAIAALTAPGAGHTEVLVLVDVFGATPCNVALRAADGVRVRVVAGVNVPMLWRTLCYASEPLGALVTRAVDGGTQGVVQVSMPRRQTQSPTTAGHDQQHHHHQQ